MQLSNYTIDFLQGVSKLKDEIMFTSIDEFEIDDTIRKIIKKYLLSKINEDV